MATRKRGQGEGSIYRRSDGRWAAAFSTGDGRRRTVYGSTRAVAAQKLAEAQRAHSDGMLPEDGRVTVSQFAQKWLESTKHSIRPTTYKRYEGLLRVNVLPVIGSMRLTRLQPAHLESLYSNRLDGGLSAQSVTHIHRVVHAMLEKAARWGVVSRNVASLVSPPRVPHREMKTLSAEQARALLGAAKGTRLEALWWLAIGTGMRSGEILGLRWQDIELESQRLHVRYTLHRYDGTYELAEPKTSRSRRFIALSSTLIAKLSQHRNHQSEERLAIGPAWNDEGFVFADPVGRPFDVSNFPRQFMKPLLAEAGLPQQTRFHDLRHTAISLALSRGVAATDVAEMAGHSSVALTLTRYAHALPDAPRRATDAIDAALAG